LNILKQLSETLIQAAKQVAAILKTIALAAKDRQQRGILNKLEIERLDRIRNPEKYRGKEI
jgi:hypothetical protein